MDLVQATATPNLIRNVFIADSSASTGAGKTGLTYASFKAYYKRNKGASSAQITLVALTAPGVYQSGAIGEIDSVNLPGLYEFHIPNAAVSGGGDGSNEVCIMLTDAGSNGAAATQMDIRLVAFNPDDATAMGLSAFGNVTVGGYASGQAPPSTSAIATAIVGGSTPIAVDSSGCVTANNLLKIGGQTITAHGAVTVNAQVGTSTAIAFDTNGYVKADMFAVSTPSGVGVNVTSIAGTAVAVELQGNSGVVFKQIVGTIYDIPFYNDDANHWLAGTTQAWTPNLNLSIPVTS
jgi:hypothetical protein